MTAPASPAPAGLARIDAFLVAPQATGGERAITYLAAVAGGGLALALAATAGLPALALLVITLVAVDAVGGAVANATGSAQRWWHRPGRTRTHQLGFVAAHGQPFLLAATVPGFGWTAATAVYAVAVAGAVLVLVAPSELRRPVGFAATVLGVTVLTALADIPTALAWFAPVLLIKLLLAHLLPWRSPWRSPWR
ncbi:hypothetical protein JQS43_01700 [Natronosporangium hydrolyticum]|uniref:Uncharacterized protein n=1 Tax=Natronosporangium hydrolyticum TaxID=2811111 RepID=A0A895YGV5_9ACTN|nr:hypothetical protein JQS43_01700 [Natronosporangium hydrolyticum]